MEPFYKRTWAEIDLDALRTNFQQVKNCLTHASTKVMAVVKADAYGHGVEHCAQELAAAGADWFGVSSLAEALQLRHYGLRQPILIFGYTPPAQAQQLAEYGLSQTVFCSEYAEQLSIHAQAAGVQIPIHVKIDTGMSRLGFIPGEAKTIEDIVHVCRLPGLTAQGIYTHFPSADYDGDPDGSVTQTQFETFTATIHTLAQKGIHFALRHCANSATTIAHPQMHLDMVRAGIVLYGLAPSAEVADRMPLAPVMQLKTVVSMVKPLPTGTFVSYGRTFCAPQDTMAATVNIGYADGYPRCLSGKAEMLVCGQKAPVIGRVCMDQLMLDVGQIQGVSPGMTVTVFGRDGDAFLPVDQLARQAGTIHYELVCLVGRRVPRVYSRNGEIVAVTDYLA